jgi:methylmalonyl-CoA mutase C-terminal domain/subunit
MTVFPRVMKALKENDAEDIIVAGGGVIPDDDITKLTEMGVQKIMLQDTPPDEIVNAFRQLVAERGPR